MLNVCSFQSINSKNKDYVVIIAKRIHLFPYRTQKLSSLALMVLGGKLPGRVRRSHVMCRSGGTGRRTGLKILRDLPPVPVRFRSLAPFIINIAGWSSWQLVGLITRRAQVRVLPPQPIKMAHWSSGQDTALSRR